jgi:hypothetical protein
MPDAVTTAPLVWNLALVDDFRNGGLWSEAQIHKLPEGGFTLRCRLLIFYEERSLPGMKSQNLS